MCTVVLGRTALAVSIGAGALAVVAYGCANGASDAYGVGDANGEHSTQAPGVDAGSDASADGTDGVDATTNDVSTDDVAQAVDAADGSAPDSGGDAGDAGTGPTTIVVVRAGTGTSTLTTLSAPVFLDEVRVSDGAVVRTTPLPTAANGSNQPCTLTGSAVTEGSLQLSADEHYLTLTGYGVGPGQACGIATAADVVSRVVARVDAAWNVDTTTTLGNVFGGGNVRGAYSLDGGQFWASGYDADGGFVYATYGASSSVRLVNAPASGRFAAGFGGQLYGSSGTANFLGVFSIGTGLPTAAGASTSVLVSNQASPFGFVILDRNASVPGLDTIYLADDGAAGSGGGLQKWTFDGATWSHPTTFASGITGVRHVTPYVSAAGVLLFVTTAEAQNRLGTFLDDGVNTNPAFSPILTASANTALHGVAFPPH